MVMAVAKAVESGAHAIVCASTGNTSASAAAYGAAAGLEVIVVLPKGQIALGKLLQALMAGARVVAVDGNFDQALHLVRGLAEQDDHPVTLVNSVNPFRLDGQKTAAFEICDDLGRAPDVLAIPVGNAGNISAYWAGFVDYARAGLVGEHAADVRASRPPAPRHRRSATASTSPRRSRRPSASAIRHRGTRRSGRATSRAAGSRPSPTTRSSPPIATWPGWRASSASPPRPPPSPVSASRPPPVASRATSSSWRPDRPRPQGPEDRRGNVPGVIEAGPTLGAVAVALGWT